MAVMLIVLIAFAFILFAAFICGVAIGRTGRDSLRAEIHRLREEVANVTGARDTLQITYDHMREIAKNALVVAREKHFPQTGCVKCHAIADTYVPVDGANHCWGCFAAFLDTRHGPESVAHSMPDYVPPEVKNCPACNVSVRSDSWPQECPACGCTFGFN
jgi:hypothetical protein